MKKALIIILGLLLVFVLSACGASGKAKDKETSEVAIPTKTYVTTINGMVMEVIYTYDGDDVLTQTSKNRIAYSALGMETKEEV